MSFFTLRATKYGVFDKMQRRPSMKKNRWIIPLVALMALVIGLNAAGIFGAETGAGSAADPVVTKSYVDELFATVNQGGSTIFQVVEVPAGSKLIGGAGTEMILRGGKATAIDNGVDGISDLTAGKDLKSSTAVISNHLLLVPKDDGRGISCSVQSWVMVKGEYTIE